MRISLQITQFISSSNSSVNWPRSRVSISSFADSIWRCKLPLGAVSCRILASRFASRSWHWRSWVACGEFKPGADVGNWEWTKKMKIMQTMSKRSFEVQNGKTYIRVVSRWAREVQSRASQPSWQYFCVSRPDRTELDPSSSWGNCEPCWSICSQFASTLILLPVFSATYSNSVVELIRLPRLGTIGGEIPNSNFIGASCTIPVFMYR